MDAARISRTRIGVAVGLVAVLAIGLAVTSRSSHERPRAKPSGAAESGKAATVSDAAAPSPSPVISAGSADHFRQLQALIPDRSVCQYDPNAEIPDLRCTRDGVLADYLLLDPAKVLKAYFEIVGENRRHSRSAASACASGREDERGWASPAEPRLTAGRFSCRIEHGSPTIWWTVPGRGLLARAVMTNGNLAQLFAWWASHSERWAA